MLNLINMQRKVTTGEKFGSYTTHIEMKKSNALRRRILRLCETDQRYA